MIAAVLGILLQVAAASAESCLSCHAAIEEMHPAHALTCTQCHGGDAKATTKEAAHVAPSRTAPNDERTLPLDWDPAFLRFQNPMNLRVVETTCGTCHANAIDHLRKSLHGTTAGHLSDGLYENGVTRTRSESYAIFRTEKLPQ